MQKQEQLVHIVFGGVMRDLDACTFEDLDAIEVVGFYPDYATALAAWRSAAQQSVDHANKRFFIVHLHRYLQPGKA